MKFFKYFERRNDINVMFLDCSAIASALEKRGMKNVAVRNSPDLLN
jgi:hypothetical protein